MSRRSQLLSVLALSGSLVLGACGGSDGDVAADANGTTVEGATAGEGLSGGDLAESSTTTAAETTTTAPPSTEAEPTTSAAPETTVEPSTTLGLPAVDGPADGVPYVDAEGVYSLLIGPDWVVDDQSLPGTFDLWFTGVETPGFAENVNVLSESLPGVVSVSEILAASESQIAAQFANFELERSEVVVGENYPELGVLEYTGTASGVDGRFLQVFGLWDGRMVIVTVSTDASLGREGIERLEPYALTVAPAG